MGRMLEIVTPEHVAIRYELAGFGARGVAASIDVIVQLLFTTLALALLATLSWLNLMPPFWESITTDLLFVLLIFGYTFIFLGYHIVFETLWNGETPGKRALQLRVIKDGGYPVDFRAVVIRNLIRLVDMMPGVPPIMLSYAVAFVAVALNPQYKRLGDMAAGTLVVRHRTGDDARARILGMGDAVTYRLLEPVHLTQIARLTRDEFRMITQFLDRSDELPLSLRVTFAERLATPLITRLAFHLPEFGMDYHRWLEEVALAYHHRATGGGLSLTPPSAPATAPPPAPAVATTTPADDDTRRW